MKISLRRFFFFTLCLSHLWFGLAAADTYTLSIGEKLVNLTGKKQTAIVANDGLPSPTLHWREGEDVTLHVINRLQEPTSIHWHGIVLPYQMDGVPGVSFPGIEPGETFTYRFQVKQHGTYWYHGHSGMQEQQGLFGALVIDPVPPQSPAERDYVLLLSDWPEADPYRTHARLKKQSDYYNFQKRTVFDFFNDIRQHGFSDTISDRLAWGQMRMEPTDLADVTGATYHFLVNGHTPAMNWTGLFSSGDRVRLRIINASAMTYFDVRIPGLAMHVIAADGQAVMPVDVEEFRIAVAETYDVLVEPKADRAYRIFAEAMDRSGFAAATLTPRIGLLAELPKMRPRTLLTMADMEGHGGHGEHDHHDQHEGMPMSDTAEKPIDAEHAEHSEHTMHQGHGASMPMTEPEKSRQEAPAMGSYKALSYQHLMAAAPNPEWRQPDREITLRLTGNMYRYIWSFDDIKYSESEPIRVKFGEHIRFTYVNETMMNHPIHLHGLWQYLDNGNGAYNPKKHVINVPPGKTVSVIVVADAEGEWAFHCHLLYHMDAGMFRKLIVEKGERTD
ncbi:copper resistance system multicopper oxidase [Methylomicrobium sp. Wu6]|uniref:copper resistance system multicopper oxidase n=1 Tax=Methylomicrobium sp. Wu6 TaxID=3107928 RepID=UPI002DD66DF3|nr:copper resistance system multicopper oxidase [Methylomicrobium sp. Wu6]MEC4748827.1 copper resistance system multicopper oxidase [Methylomicrobium sp. Wu6]